MTVIILKMHVWIIVRSQSTGSNTATSSKLFTVWRTGATFHKKDCLIDLTWACLEKYWEWSSLSTEPSILTTWLHRSHLRYKLQIIFCFSIWTLLYFQQQSTKASYWRKKPPGARSVVLHRLQHLDGGREPVEGGHHQQRDRWRGVHLELLTSLSPLLHSSTW